MTFGFRKQKSTSDKPTVDQKMDMLVKLGRDQFKKLLEKGIGVPVALL